MKKIIVMFTVLMLALSGDLFAKGGGFSGGRAASFGSRSFSTTGSKSSSSGGSKSFSFGSKSQSTVSAPSKLFETFKAANTTPSKRVVASDINRMFDRSYRQNRRQSFYGGYTTPSYAQPIIMQHSNYGAWDSLMMWSMLDSISDRNMYYHHQNDPSFQSWRNDANQLCNQGNQEVCNKLKDLDKEVAEIKSKGVKQDPTYMTEGVDPNIYIADNVKYDDLGEVKICTGTMTSDYTRFANQIAEKTKLKIKTISTNGSMDNLSKMAHGDCDMAFTQSDTLVTQDLEKVFELDKSEQSMLLCNNNSGVKSVNDLNSDITVYVGSDQTGSQYTYDTLVSKKVGSFGKNLLNNSKSTVQASTIVDENDKSCLFVVDTFDAPYVKQMATVKKSHLVAFPDDVSGYTKSYIDDNAYKTLTQDKYSSWLGFWSKGTPVLSVKPVLVTTDAWAQNNPVILYDVMMLNKQYLRTELQ